MLDKANLKKLGWSENLINEVNNIAEELNDKISNIENPKFEEFIPNKVVSSSSYYIDQTTEGNFKKDVKEK